MSECDDFPEPALNRYGILPSPETAAAYSALDESVFLTLHSELAALQIDKRDGTIALLRPDGQPLLQHAASPMLSSADGYSMQFVLSDDEKLYGLGDETRSRIQKRGHIAYMHAEPQHAYVPVPFLMSSRGWGLLVNTTWRQCIDIGGSVSDLLHIRCDGGEPDFYLFAGEPYAQLLNRYTDIAGKPALLPLWAYGLTFSCNQQANARDVVEDALNFRRAGIPCDTLGLEPGWMETYYDHSKEKKWHPERFSIPAWASKGPRTFFGALDRIGFKLSLWLCCNYDLSRHEELLLTGQAASEEGREEAWYTHLAKFVEQGVSAFKLDGGHRPIAEPEREWANGMSPAEIHNLYHLLLVKQMHLGFKQQTGRRAMIYAMSGYTGIQQYAATWAGTSGGGAESLVSMLNHGLSGHIHTTCDMDIHSAEGIHFGFLQPWSHLNNFAYWQHPCLLNPELLQLFRSYAKLRYSLIPYLYSAAHTAVRTGMPILRAMPLCFPNDARSDELFHQYMLGDSLLVAAFGETVYLPAGTWIDYWTSERHTGPKELRYTVPKQAGGPLFVRAGAIIPVWPEVECVGTVLPDNIGVHLYPCASGEFTLYEDDGITYRYLEGELSETKLSIHAGEESFTVQIEPRSGRFEGMPQNRGYRLYVHLEGKPYKLSVNGQPLKEWNLRPDGEHVPGGWYFDPELRQVHLFAQEDESKQAPLRIDVLFDATERRSFTADGKVAGSRAADSKSIWSVWERELEVGLVSGDLSRLHDSLDSIWQNRLELGWNTNEVKEYLLYVSGTLIRIAERNGWRMKDVAGDDYNELIHLPLLTLSEGTLSLLRRVLQKFADQFRVGPAPAKNPLIRQVTALIEQSPAHDIPLQTVAELLHVNSSHLSRTFRKELGMPFSAYVLEKKMQRAKRLLLEGERIIEVSAALGYKDPSHFIRVFRTYWGITPGELIAPIKKTKNQRKTTLL
nr:TIM-barrel domain-containing protein [Paenibacillus ginsengarvi]